MRATRSASHRVERPNVESAGATSRRARAGDWEELLPAPQQTFSPTQPQKPLQVPISLKGTFNDPISPQVGFATGRSGPRSARTGREEVAQAMNVGEAVLKALQHPRAADRDADGGSMTWIGHHGHAARVTSARTPRGARSAERAAGAQAVSLGRSSPRRGRPSVAVPGLPGHGVAAREDVTTEGGEAAAATGEAATSEALGGAAAGFSAASSSHGGRRMRLKMGAKRFEAKLSSFQDLLTSENNPTSVVEILEQLETITKGSGFTWERRSSWNGGYGASVIFSFQLILWYQNNLNRPDVKTRTSTSVSFVHKPGCAFIYQPIVPLTSLMITPRRQYRPMFELDPRSFHTFKLAWKQFLDFGVSDYRIIVGEQLERWTQQCKLVIQRPVNTVYWLMLMVGSYYSEELVSRGVLQRMENPPSRVPVIRVDSFVALSALLFSPERQVLYAGIDPTTSYLKWLQYVGDQHSDRKEATPPGKLCTVFERNEFFDVPVVIVFYGRIVQKAKNSDKPWIGNPELVKNYIGRYADDNCSGSQLEAAVRLYSFSCALGRLPGDDGGEGTWHTWNGLSVCEIGVPMPCTQATYLFPFTTARPIALLCPVHGPDGRSKDGSKDTLVVSEGEARPEEHSERTSIVSRGSTRTSKGGSESTNGSSESDDEEFEQDSNASRVVDPADASKTRGGRGGKSRPSLRHCICARYLKSFDAENKDTGRRHNIPFHTVEFKSEIKEALQALGDFDVMHCFAAILSGGLNLAKRIIRLHFSIDTGAYANLPPPGKSNWQDGMLPWYRELHRPDAHGRSRYTMMLEAVVHGLLGDGFTSGFHEEALDVLRSDGRGLADNTALFAADEAEPSGLGSSTARGAQKLGFGAAGVSTASVPGSPRAGSGLLGSAGVHSGAYPQTPRARQEREGHVTAPGQLGRNFQGIVGDITLWTKLYETESLLDHKAHFEHFKQWCHSAHLVPFLKRCYRRCGISGLIVGQHSGGFRLGMDPSHPLVLPTAANFCYGHCYPLHRVLEYFYGGMETIVCSCDDPVLVEKNRNTLGLIAGQERLNNQCWFQLSEVVMKQLADDDRRGSDQDFSDGLGDRILQQLQEHLSTMKSVGKLVPGVRPKRFDIHDLEANRVRQTVGASGHRGPRPSRPGGAKKKVAPANRGQAAPSLGVMAANDPFFWFCQQNFAVYTYPAANVPRKYLQQGAGLVFKYSDFVSRTGTPEPRPKDAGDEDQTDDLFNSGKPVPPSINLCQPTETTNHVRQRWEVQKEFVDDQKMILGDAGWFPGALGHRFTFEVTTSSVERYVRSGMVPQAQLLCVEHLWVPSALSSHRAGSNPGIAAMEEISSSDDDSATAHQRLRPRLPQRKGLRQNTRGGEQALSVMLPPLPSRKGG